jgi:hypothetical protein
MKEQLTTLETEILDHLLSFNDDEYHDVPFVKFGLKHDVENATNSLEEKSLIEINIDHSFAFIDPSDTPNDPATSFSARVVR